MPVIPAFERRRQKGQGFKASLCQMRFCFKKQKEKQKKNFFYTFLPTLRDHRGRGDRKSVRTTGGGGPQGNSIFQRQQATCTDRLTAAVAACTRPVQAQVGPNPITEREDMKSHL